MPRANSSFPVPVSPTSSTVTLRLVATCVASAIASRIAGLSPTTREPQRSCAASFGRFLIVTRFLVHRGLAGERKKQGLPKGRLKAHQVVSLGDEGKEPQVTRF